MENKLGTAVGFSKAFTALKWITLVAVLLLFISNAWWSWTYSTALAQARQTVYVVSDQGTAAAVESPTATPSVYEARNHIKNFMRLMFSHDAETYKDRIDLAFKLINRQDGLAIYQTFREGKVLENYNRYNIRTELQIDSITVNVSTEPYTGTVYTQQKVIYPDEVQRVPIAARFQLRQTYRSEDNPFGLQIKEFNFMDYTPQVKEL
ncbi:VirB8 family type IV secretion system protein [Larkinella harenae]